MSGEIAFPEQNTASHLGPRARLLDRGCVLKVQGALPWLFEDTAHRARILDRGRVLKTRGPRARFPTEVAL